jgi:hypothetical protein
MKKIFLLIITASIILLSTDAYTQTKAHSSISEEQIVVSYSDELVGDIEINNESEIIHFSIVNPKQPPSLDRSAAIGIYAFMNGACFAINILSGYGCADIARYVGLELVHGFWLWQGMPYTARWKVTYGYIPGCLPMHSGVCFRATFTRIS